MLTFQIDSPFPNIVTERIIKSNERSCVSIVRDQKTNTRYFHRIFKGSADVYYKLQKIRCDNLPKIHSVMEKEGYVFVLEEFIQGDTLAFLLDNGPLPHSVTKKFTLQICNALQNLHNVGIVHRDIKPENIIIRGDEAVLIDFNVSRLTKPDSDTDTQIMGTTGYAAPEQYGFSQTDTRADIYSIGILMNEMLTKQHPSKVLANDSLCPIIERCIEVTVDKRYASVSELHNALYHCPESIPWWWQLLQKPATKIAGIILLCALIFVLLLNRQPSADETIFAQTEETFPTTATMQPVETAEIFVRRPVEVSDEPWTGSPSIYTTTFQYDIDEDGVKETYQFGIYHESIPEGYRHSLSDTFIPSEVIGSSRRVYPCVWLCKDDGTYEQATDFAPMLSDAQVTLWRTTDEPIPAPEVHTLNGIWQGGLDIQFYLENEGVWLYEISANLGDEHLTAMAQSFVAPLGLFD